MITRIVPIDWMPACPMLRIITHWTAGGWRASEEDRDHYHLIVQGDGTLLRGHHAISDNLRTSDGDYAAHTRDLNTQSIGVACCGMAGASQKPFLPGHYPITAAQYEAMLKVVADLSDRYSIMVAERRILNHGDVERVLGIPQRGKWDICVLPFNKTIADVGHYMRERVQELLKHG